MKIKTDRGIEDLNVKPCFKCGILTPPLQMFKHNNFKKQICENCFKKEEEKEEKVK